MSLLAGLAQGFAQAQGERFKREQGEELRKLQVKMFQRQLDMQEEATAARNQLLGLLTQVGIAEPPVEGSMQTQQNLTGAPPKTLKDVLATPEGQGLALKSGLAKIDDIRQFQTPNITELIASGQLGKSMGGLEVSGLKIGPNGQVMPDLSRPKLKSEVPSPDGRFMIQIDEYGREMGRRPMGPSEFKPPERTKGQTAADETFGKEYAEYTAAGGFADIQKQLTQLREASTALEREKGLSGPEVGLLPEAALKVSNPRAVAVRDAVLESAQRNLRLILGPQFTAKEGEALLARTYDPALSQAENKKRVDRLITQIETAAKAKQEAVDYFQENGTLTGFKGKLWTLADFNPGGKPSLSGPGKSNAAPMEQTAVNPKTGERLVLRNGKWQKP